MSSFCDASFHCTGFVLMIEDYPIDQKGKTKKTYAPVSFVSRLFTTFQLKFSVYYKEFLALYFALDHFAQFIWGAMKPVLVLTDNRSLTQFFHSKADIHLYGIAWTEFCPSIFSLRTFLEKQTLPLIFFHACKQILI